MTNQDYPAELGQLYEAIRSVGERDPLQLKLAPFGVRRLREVTAANNPGIVEVGRFADLLDAARERLTAEVHKECQPNPRQTPQSRSSGVATIRRAAQCKLVSERHQIA